MFVCVHLVEATGFQRGDMHVASYNVSQWVDFVAALLGWRNGSN